MVDPTNRRRNGEAENLIVPVVLAGGSGSRLWPLSRELTPKQLLPFLTERSLLQEALARISEPLLYAPPIIVSNVEHRFAIAAQARDIGLGRWTQILEPRGRNTAPAAAVASLVAMEADPDAVLLVAPADHVVDDVEHFGRTVLGALPMAKRGMLVTFGISPRAPHTGYGYIQSGDVVDDRAGVRAVRKFVEKPNLETARVFVATGEYFWNSGIFLFSARAFIEELETFEPDLVRDCRAALSEGAAGRDAFTLDAQSFGRVRSISIDNAVMERTSRAAVVPMDVPWSDLGAWSSVWEMAGHDANGNAVLGDATLVDTADSYVRSDGLLTAVVGLKDVVVVVTEDAVLVADKNRAEEVKGIVESLRTQGRNEVVSEKKVNRPWGSYKSLHSGDRFQVKQITVQPGAQLSLQKHHHRAEHWVVVNGTALVTCDDEVKLLRENESTYIPLGSVHRLENPGKVPLNLIEVQSGTYLGEDDIVRIEDTYGRVEPKAISSATPAAPDPARAANGLGDD